MEQVEIRVLFVRHPFKLWDVNSWLSTLIRLVIGFKYNHCAIKYHSRGFNFVVEARSGGIVTATWENWIKHRVGKEWIESGPIPIAEYLIDIRLGNQYNVLSLFEQLWYRVFGVWIGDKSDAQENCSEFVADLLNMPEAYKATPKSVYYLTK